MQSRRCGGNPQINYIPERGVRHVSGHSAERTRSARVLFAKSTPRLQGGDLRMWVVSAEMQLPDILQKPPKTGIRGMAHGSISIQEGQPRSRSPPAHSH